MIDIKLTSDGDFDFDQDLKFVSEIDEIKQALMILLRSRKGEFFADHSMGLDQRALIGKDYDLNYVSSNVSNALMQEKRVASVIVNEIKLIKRDLYIKFAVTLTNTRSLEMEVMLDDR